MARADAGRHAAFCPIRPGVTSGTGTAAPRTLPPAAKQALPLAVEEKLEAALALLCGPKSRRHSEETA